MNNKKLIIISLDSLSEEDLEYLKLQENLKSLLPQGTLVTKVTPPFVTNTYPIHTSVITGCYPEKHGIIDNLVHDPGNDKPEWHWYRKYIKTTTLYDQANLRGQKTLSILWPVTARANISYNMPEIFPTKLHQNQKVMSLLNGSFFMQLIGFLKYGGKLNGKRQPALDNFSVKMLTTTLEKKKPNLALIHLIETDSNKHKHGLKAKRTKESLKRMDSHIGTIMNTLNKIDRNYNIIIFSDHSSLPIEKTINPNDYLKELKIKTPTKKGDKDWEAWFKTCGGTTFLYLKDKNNWALKDIIIEHFEILIKDKPEIFRRLLSQEEMKESGFLQKAAFGIEAPVGVEYHNDGNKFLANHGYTNQNEKYKVFYFIRGEGIRKNKKLEGGSLLDITQLACRQLKIKPWHMDGKLRKDITLGEIK
ncbi:MAG: type I phosphodiesterase/nucleotide pyrophosphatase [Fusobacteria bacterium]|nr:MAG: type I phosphodiesterase/nucleotide pyrophosphatase [Fusobacteriota bacterium]KAF0229002.1 MAG: type I phosphodiesterase/nucleotide [Fusobacteriota bacterium]